MRNIMETWPNFFIVGVLKAGTTSLYAYLEKTPNVYMSPVKEPRYFNSEEFNSQFPGLGVGVREKSKYLELFQGVKNEKAIGEASPTYLSDPDAAKRIHQIVPEAKIIIILRDPVQRAFSHYSMMRLKGREKKSFQELIAERINKKHDKTNEYNFYFDPGFYTEQVKRYLNLFGEKQVKILFFEDFVKDPKKIIKEVLELLKINSELPDVIGENYGGYFEPRGKIQQKILQSPSILKMSAKVPNSLRWKIKNMLIKNGNKPNMTEPERISLESYYLNDAKNLQLLLKKKIPWKWVYDEN